MPSIQTMVELISGYRAGAAISQTIALGDRLGLYRAMRGAGPLTPQALAARVWPGAPSDGVAAIRARWLREWLLSQVAAGIIARSGRDGFVLPDASSAVLADEESLACLVGTFSTLAAQARLADKVLRALDTGVFSGDGEEEFDAVVAVERTRRPWITGILVPLVIPSLAGVARALERGATVADLCCGSGLSTIELARVYPLSTFVGYDNCAPAIERARAAAEDASIANVRFKKADVTAVVTDGPFDLVLTLDAMHEMPEPAAVARAVRAALGPDGVWLIEDPSGGPPTGDAVDVTLAGLYAGSLLTCLPNALPAALGSALGSVGFTEELARKVCLEAGFKTFRSLGLGLSTYQHFEARG